MVKTFAEILEIYNGRSQKDVENPSGAYPIYGSGGIMGYADILRYREPKQRKDFTPKVHCIASPQFGFVRDRRWSRKS